MPDLPEYMLQREREADPIFESDELLYRRVQPDDWDVEGVNLDALEFPDMSVQRQKYGPPNSARWERGNYVEWGIIGFKVGDIPTDIPFQGSVIHKMKPIHTPHKKNYPHAEVQVFESKWDQQSVEMHIDKKTMAGVPLEAQQEWRELLRRKCQIILQPGEEPAGFE